MSVETPTTGRLAADPFAIGYRYVKQTDTNGIESTATVPLTLEDYLHPQEGDRFMITEEHVRTVAHIRYAIDVTARSGLNLRTLSDHRVDWQVDDIKPHGPDVSVFRDFPDDWNPKRGTFPVQDEGSLPLIVFEVTSVDTRSVDFEGKYLEYEEAGIPYYVIVDVAGPEFGQRLLAFRNTPNGFVPMEFSEDLGVEIPELHLWFRWNGDRIVVADANGNDIPEAVETAVLYDEAKQQLATEKRRYERQKQRAEAEKQRAEAEKQRAEAEKQRAEAEKQRADELLRELAELKARLAQPKTEELS